MKTIDYTPEEKLISETIAKARKVQEFIWQEDSVSLCPFDKDNWIRIFQKRVDKIKDLKLENPNYFVELRKRLLQQGALSVLALRLISSDESELSALKSAKEEVKSAEILSADEMLTNHFLDDNWEPNYQNIVKIMDKFHSQFQSVQSKEEKPQFNYFQSRDLTDAEWLAMPKEEILQLYKNCYKLLMENFKPHPVQSVKGEGERTAEEELPFNRTIYIRAKNLDYALFCEWFNTIRKKLESYKHSESKEQKPSEIAKKIVHELEPLRLELGNDGWEFVCKKAIEIGNNIGQQY